MSEANRILQSFRRPPGRPQDGDELPKKPMGRAALLESLKRRMEAKELGRKAVAAPVVAPAKLTSDGESVEKTSSSGRESSSDDQIAKLSMEPGTKGTPIPLSANFIKLDLDPSKRIHRYVVEFDPPIDDKRLRYALVSRISDVVGKTRSFDGTTLSLPLKLADDVTTLEVESPRDPATKFEVKIVYQATKSPSSDDCTQHYNLLFQKVMHTLKFERMKAKSKFFDPSNKTSLPEHRLEVWPGYVTSVNSYQGGVLLCCDVSHRILQNERIWDTFKDIWHEASRTGQDPEKEAKRAVIGEVVLTRYNNMTYRVDDVDFKSNPGSTFNYRGSEISFKDYYKKQYDIDIVDMRQPLLLSFKNMKADQDQKQMLTMLIPELCFKTGLSQRQRDDFKVMKDVSFHTHVTPQQRALKRDELLRQIKTCPEAYSILQNWGISLPDSWVDIEGRVLDSQPMLFGNNQEIRLKESLHRAVQENRMFRSIRLDRWVLVYDRKSEAMAKRFRDSLPQCASRLGMQVACPAMKPVPNERADSYVRAVKSSYDPNQPYQMVVTMVPSKREDRYGAIKKLCSVELPVLSQVIVSKTLMRRDPESIVTNIAMQMNAKLGGEPWAAKSTYKNAMVMGIDVAHDPRNMKRSVSVLCASLNKNFSRWYSGCKDQLPNMELMEGLQYLTIQALVKYKENNGALPDRVIVFRDGVGDGRLNFTKDYEVPQIQEAFRRFQPNYMPKLSFIVVSKRIMTRLALVSRGGIHENPPPGTVVDHTITSRNSFPDFYLVSQKSRQGSVSPTHYIIINNDGQIPADQLQVLTYRLTYMYYNSKDPIRVPAPCQYADRLAGMVAKHLRKAPNIKLCDTLHFI